jgi:hypothetical protein
MGRPKKYKTDKERHIASFLSNSWHRSLRHKLPFDLTFEYLMSIATDECPIFKTPFKWGINKTGKGRAPNDSPSLDKIEPELGYTQGNVAFISRRANKMKDDGTMQEHYAIADWIWNQTHAKQKSAAPVSEGSYIQGAVGAELGSVSTPWTWQDSDDTDNHSGAIHRQDADHSTQTSSGDSVGYGSEEVATPIPFESFQDYGLTKEQVRGIIEDLRRIPD